MISKSTNAKEPLKQMRMPSLEDPVKRAENIAQMPRKGSLKVLTTEDAWCSIEVQKAQLEDIAIRPILEKKLNSEYRPSWQEIAPESPATKRYWALWDSLHLKDGV
ncbi:hypothetical protein AVEN_535-1 [Araneus ventricosus]|uniref:Uncharacterized protein n=1 Tax=Araneus ventricosus TaxID=182803 RepID=A0A4Y2I8K2_ARAVE|nr:hypothetical protein AVEN_535-1 [Araneus ventricosus]